MTQVSVKRVYEPEDKKDGFRVFTDRLWPRGIRKEDLQYDLWPKNIAPTTQLRKWFHENPEERWREFRRRYTLELEQSPDAAKFLDAIKGHEKITLLYGARNTVENQALVLKEFIERNLK